MLHPEIPRELGASASSKACPAGDKHNVDVERRFWARIRDRYRTSAGDERPRPNRLAVHFACISVDPLGRSFDGISKPIKAQILAAPPSTNSSVPGSKCCHRRRGKPRPWRFHPVCEAAHRTLFTKLVNICWPRWPGLWQIGRNGVLIGPGLSALTRISVLKSSSTCARRP